MSWHLQDILSPHGQSSFSMLKSPPPPSFITNLSRPLSFTSCLQRHWDQITGFGWRCSWPSHGFLWLSPGVEGCCEKVGGQTDRQTDTRTRTVKAGGMNLHQVLTGAVNPGDNCFSVGSINNVPFTVSYLKLWEYSCSWTVVGEVIHHKEGWSLKLSHLGFFF